MRKSSVQYCDKPAKTTVGPYRDILERLWIVDPVPAWLPSRNHLMRLGAAPKHHLADPALAARLLAVDVAALIEGRADELSGAVPRDGTLLGALFESLVDQSLRVYAQHAEAIVRHLRWLKDQIGPDLLDAVIVTTGPDAYRRRDDIAVVPAALIGP